MTRQPLPPEKELFDFVVEIAMRDIARGRETLIQRVVAFLAAENERLRAEKERIAYDRPEAVASAESAVSVLVKPLPPVRWLNLLAVMLGMLAVLVAKGLP